MRLLPAACRLLPAACCLLPAVQDFTLQNGDSWFYSKTSGVHSPAQLRNMYEQSSGSNTGLIIDIAPFPNGSVPKPQVAAARALGKQVVRSYVLPACVRLSVCLCVPYNYTDRTAGLSRAATGNLSRRATARRPRSPSS